MEEAAGGELAAAASQLAGEIAARLEKLPSQTIPLMRSIRRESSRRLTRESPELVVRVAEHLAARSGIGFRFVAYELLSHHKAAFKNLTSGQLLALGKGLDSWGAVDCFACYLSGPAWRDGQINSAVIRKWAKSEDRWLRRTALVSTVALSRRGEPDDVSRTIEICSLLAGDTDDLVAKAMSWALRELAKKHPKQALKFLETHKQSLAARVKREVQNKITIGLKNPRRRDDVRE